jgi:hypothetical protein
MLLAFFDSKGLVYTRIIPKGTAINANYILVVLGKFMVHLRKKRPEMTKGNWFFHWDNAPVHTAASVKNWLAAKGIQLLPHPPIRLIWRQRTSSCSEKLKRSWLAFT